MVQSKGSALAILIVDDEANIRKTMSVCLETEGHRVTAVGNPEDALAEASRRSFDVAFVDLRLGVASGLDLIPSLLNTSPWLRIIVITAYASIDTAVEAVKRGATDYIPKPFTPAQIKLAVHKVFEMRSLEQKVASLREDLGRSRFGMSDIFFMSGLRNWREGLFPIAVRTDSYRNFLPCALCSLVIDN